MPNTLASLWKWQPKFVGQKLYCDEIRHWCIAVKSARGDGRLVWLLPPVQPFTNDNVLSEAEELNAKACFPFVLVKQEV